MAEAAGHILTKRGPTSGTKFLGHLLAKTLHLSRYLDPDTCQCFLLFVLGLKAHQDTYTQITSHISLSLDLNTCRPFIIGILLLCVYG